MILFVAFIVNQLSEPVKMALFLQLFDILAASEFIDFILSFLQEAVQNYPGALSGALCETIAAKMSYLRENDLSRSLQSSTGSKMTMQQRETMESLVKRYRSNPALPAGADLVSAKMGAPGGGQVPSLLESNQYQTEQ